MSRQTAPTNKPKRTIARAKADHRSTAQRKHTKAARVVEIPAPRKAHASEPMQAETDRDYLLQFMAENCELSDFCNAYRINQMATFARILRDGVDDIETPVEELLISLVDQYAYHGPMRVAEKLHNEIENFDCHLESSIDIARKMLQNYPDLVHAEEPAA